MTSCWSWMAIAALTALGLAGCLGDQDAATSQEPAADAVWPSPDWAIAALAGGEGHDHRNHEQHEGRTTPNFEPVGYDPHATEHAGGTSGGYLCGEARTFEGRSLAVTQSHYDAVGLLVSDVTDPAAPELIGELVLEGLDVYDSALTTDARYALVAVTGARTSDIGDDPAAAGGPRVPVRAVWEAPCGTVAGPFVAMSPTASVLLVDLEDPTRPTVIDQFQQPGLGVHSVSAATVDGTHYVVASSTNFAGPATYFTFFTIGPDPVTGSTGLQLFGIYDASNTQSTSLAHSAFNGHNDGMVHQHPVTGQVLAYLANWDGGMVVVELVRPGVVRHVSDWGAVLQDARTLAIHSTLPLDELWGDRHITVVGEETITPDPGLPTGRVMLLDTTDPAAPEEVAVWTLPVEEGGWDESLIFSPHYAAVVGQTVFVSMYHGGVWAFDASPEHWPYPPTTGVFVPATRSPSPPVDIVGGWAVMTFAPSVLEVFALPDGTLLSWDSMSGLHTYRFHEDDARVEPVPNWFE